ncbi:DEAD/DEAH box helicase family protein [Lachnospiraceae bacterium KK002]
MSNTTKIQSFTHVVPMIYAYNTPGVTYHEGWTKIGYTEKQTVSQRINQQAHTVGIKWELAWQDNAMFKDGSGEYFTDREFHTFLESAAKIEREPGTEWFKVSGQDSQNYFNQFSRRENIEQNEEKCTYVLRKEQQEAVTMTREYFKNGGSEFLWNAKPRFGKTLASYDLICNMGFTKVLIVTNRPSIANSWADDFHRFIAWKEKLCFVSDTDALKDKPGVMTRDEYTKVMTPLDDTEVKGMVAFESLQGLKGSVYFGGDYKKLKWMSDLEFDLLIVDEAQEGVDTIRTDRAFSNITRKHTLYLSGTPFKALANEQFAPDQIFNWSYADEQEAKEKWDKDDYNPYEALPRLTMYTYRLSNMIYEKIQKGMELPDEEGSIDYAFDLNEFFMTNESGRFIHEEEICKFFHALNTQERYPFSTPELREELSHTLWILNRVSSAKALAKLLKEDEVFKEYHVVLAAGDGKLDTEKENESSYNKVKNAIAEYDKTITLSVGQLTVGVTVPEWSGVLMLCNMKSPSSYMQAAFRAQNPCIMTRNGQRYRKETAYIFDFDPARTLIIFDKFANNLSPDTVGGHGTGEERKDNIKRLLNFFPVLGEDEEGTMEELDAAAVLSIPRKIKSQEVVRRGFLSNFLFQNISNVFGAPNVVKEIVEKLTPAHEESKKGKQDTLEGISDVAVNENGEVEIPKEVVIGKAQDLFGTKVYEQFAQDVQSQVNNFAESGTYEVDKQIETLVDTVKDSIKENVLAPVINEYEVKKGMQNRLEKQVNREIERSFEKIQGDYKQQAAIAKAEFEQKQKVAESEQEVKVAEQEFQKDMADAMATFVKTVEENVQKTIEDKPKELVEQLERNKAEQEKNSVEEEVRAHLRGFSRTIPSFIMAYGDGELTLANFDDYTEDDVFLEVTGITEEDFRFLRDGGEYENPESGEMEYFEGHLFDEVVFNDSIQEFWNKKQQLANYFDESLEEDIFDYIPPQKTNQIFTPKWVVTKMVDELEANNPGCFDDPDKTFADLYMKSGLYITEIVKRLYRSEAIKTAFPDDKERIRHILQKQVYGMAPTRIIYLIATNYILGFDEDLKEEVHNFIEADAAEAAKKGELERLVEECFGGWEYKG